MTRRRARRAWYSSRAFEGDLPSHLLMAEELRGWKDIGAHFGTSDRTAQRWERDHGMPVHRTGRTRGASVFAVVHELDAWRLSPAGARADSENGEPLHAEHPSTVAERPGRRRVIALLVAAILVVVAAAGLAAVWAIRGRKVPDTLTSGASLPDAYAVPKSPLVFLLDVTRDDGTPFQFHVLDGGMATLAVRYGVKLGFTPVSRGPASQLVVFRITPDGSGEAIRELKRMPLALGSKTRFDYPGMTVDIEWIKMLESSDLPAAPQDTPRHCCIVAGDVTACAAQVSVSSETAVGSCCGFAGCTGNTK